MKWSNSLWTWKKKWMEVPMGWLYIIVTLLSRLIDPMGPYDVKLIRSQCVYPVVPRKKNIWYILQQMCISVKTTYDKRYYRNRTKIINLSCRSLLIKKPLGISDRNMYISLRHKIKILWNSQFFDMAEYVLILLI